MMGVTLGGFETEIQKKPEAVGAFDEPVVKTLPPEPPKTYVDIPDIDPASGAAIGTSTRTEVAKRKPFEKYPTIAEFEPGSAGLPFSAGAKLSAGIPFSSNPQQLVDMLKENVPGVKFTTDKYGNPMAVINDQYYHLDRPDFNALDFSRGVSKIGAALPLAGAAEFVAPLAAGAPLATIAQTGAGVISNLIEQTIPKISGAKEPYNLPEAAVSGVLSGAAPLVGKAGASFVQLMAPDVFATLPTGAQNFFKKYAEKLRIGEIPDAKAAEDMMLDDPRMASIAREIMIQDSPASDIIQRAVATREAGRQARVTADVTSNLGRQTTTEQEMDQSLKAFKNVLSDELAPVLRNAPNIDPSSVIARIDEALKTAKGDTRNALINARKMLVLDSGSPAIAPVRRPVTGPEGEFKGRYEYTIGQEAKPPVYETSPKALEEARVALDRMINLGDNTIGVAPKALAKDVAISGVRRELSNLLKKQIPEYEKIMGKYSNIYDLIEANEAGTNIFKTGKDQLRPNQVKALLDDPDTALAFKNGVRAAWENKLRNSPNDISALRKGMGGEGDYIRENMELIYGKDAVENLLSAAERESAYAKTAADLTRAREIGVGKIGPETTRALEEPIVSGELADLPRSLITYPINRPAKFVRGQVGPKFEEGRAQFLTARGPQIRDYRSGFERAMERAAATKPFQSIAPAVAPQVPDYVRSLNEASGGRIGHASGGKAGVMTPESLLRDLKRRKVMMANKTEQMLSLPDDAVVQALDAAKR